MTKFLKIHTNCKVTKGIKRSTISDLQRNITLLIPNDLVDIIFYLNQYNSIDNLIGEYGIENKNTVLEYIDFLIKNELGFLCTQTDFELFPDIDDKILLPNIISNAVISNSNFSPILNQKILIELHNLGCQFLSIHLSKTTTLEEIVAINQTIQELKFISFELILCYDFISFNNIIEYFKKNENKITNITFYNAPIDKSFKFGVLGLFEVNYFKKDISCFKNCGIVNQKYFYTHQDNYFESLNHNSCLNKKISIDKEGYIKNCPSMPQSFGNINDTTLEQALDHPDFKKYWNVTKDRIDICKDCEFRHICTDCRAYTERNHFDGEIDLSKPLKCGYNPYTNEWSEWSTNPLKEIAIEYYGLQDLVKEDD